jgi:hypothetical protein
VQIARSRGRTVSLGIVVVAIVVGAVWYARRSPASEEPSVVQAKASPVSPHTNPSDTDSAAGAGGHDLPAPESETIAHSGSNAYPVKLDALRARFPDNRYWALGAPTSDPAVAKARAARAEADNKALGRITANDASPEEIHAYYAERRAISRDYLQISQAVLDEQGDALPARDRGMFELSVKMHQDRLKQIERDEADALARRSNRP